MRAPICIGLCSRFDHAIGYIADHDRSRTAIPTGTDAGVVSALGQICEYGWGNALIQQQIAAHPSVIIEARNQMARLETRRLYRRFRVHAKLDDVQEHLD